MKEERYKEGRKEGEREGMEEERYKGGRRESGNEGEGR